MIDALNFKDPKKDINDHEDMNYIRNLKRHISANKKRQKSHYNRRLVYRIRLLKNFEILKKIIQLQRHNECQRTIHLTVW